MELHAVRRLAVLDGARERHAVRRLADDEGTRRRDVAMREVEVSARRYAFEQGAFLKPVREELGNAQSLRQSCSLGQSTGLSGSCGTRLVGAAEPLAAVSEMHGVPTYMWHLVGEGVFILFRHLGYHARQHCQAAGVVGRGFVVLARRAFDASFAPLPAFPIEFIACMTASATSFGFRIVVAALSI